MIIKVILSPGDVQNILLAHVKSVCALKSGEHEYVEVQRVGDPPPTFEATCEVKRRPTSVRD